MPTPNKPHLRLWVEALRHGGFNQARGVLRDDAGAMCCLGVAQVVAMNHGWSDPDWWADNTMDPGIAEGFYGINVDPRLFLSDDPGDASSSYAATCNDMLGMTFDEIADAVERTFKLKEPDIEEEPSS